MPNHYFGEAFHKLKREDYVLFTQKYFNNWSLKKKNASSKEPQIIIAREKQLLFPNFISIIKIYYLSKSKYQKRIVTVHSGKTYFK